MKMAMYHSIYLWEICKLTMGSEASQSKYLGSSSQALSNHDFSLLAEWASPGCVQLLWSARSARRPKQQMAPKTNVRKMQATEQNSQHLEIMRNCHLLRTRFRPHLKPIWHMIEEEIVKYKPSNRITQIIVECATDHSSSVWGGWCHTSFKCIYYFRYVVV